MPKVMPRVLPPCSQHCSIATRLEETEEEMGMSGALKKVPIQLAGWWPGVGGVQAGQAEKLASASLLSSEP